MNISLLKLDLQKQAKKCFASFKNDILHYPLKDVMTKEELIDFGISNSIEGDFRGNWMNNYMSNDLSKAQMKVYNDMISHYKNLTKQVAVNWSSKILKTE